jgi:hypothetical protein
MSVNVFNITNAKSAQKFNQYMMNRRLNGGKHSSGSGNKKQHIITKYYSDLCPHCVHMKEDWNKVISTIMNNYTPELPSHNLVMANVDVDNGMSSCDKKYIPDSYDYVPTIAIIVDGKKVSEFQGERTFQNMLNWVVSNEVSPLKIKKVQDQVQVQHKNQVPNQDQDNKLKPIVMRLRFPNPSIMNGGSNSNRNNSNNSNNSNNKNQKTQKRKKWSLRYKRSINCRRPRGFSQKQYCKWGRKSNK